MLEAVEGGENVTGHRNGDGFGDVVPIEGQAEELRSGFIGGDLVLISKGGEEVVQVLSTDILYPEVVDDEGEGDGAGGMAPKGRCE